jgi:hypothetical protein
MGNMTIAVAKGAFLDQPAQHDTKEVQPEEDRTDFQAIASW